MLGILPDKGLMRVKDLAEYLEVDIDTVIKRLTKSEVPIIKMSTLKNGWMIRIDDLK